MAVTYAEYTQELEDFTGYDNARWARKWAQMVAKELDYLERGSDETEYFHNLLKTAVKTIDILCEIDQGREDLEVALTEAENAYTEVQGERHDLWCQLQEAEMKLRDKEQELEDYKAALSLSSRKVKVRRKA